MDIRALKYFQAVAECGSYSRGSEMLRISQPAVSRTIRALEEELGRSLFKRNGHGVSLTSEGRVLFERAQSLLRQIDQTRAEIRSGQTEPSGIVSLAVPPAAGQFLVPELVERFGQRFPNVFLKIVGGFSGYIHELLVRGQVDLACVHDPLPQRGFLVTPLLEEEVFLVGAPGRFPHGRDHALTDDLATLPLILPSRPNASRRLLDRWTAGHAASIAPRIEVDDHTITRALVKQGVGFTLLTAAGVESDLRRGEVEAYAFRPRARWPLALVTIRSTPPSLILEALIGAIQETTSDLRATKRWPTLPCGVEPGLQPSPRR